ncbi:MAG: DUF6132 family protein [Alphaproteobacteria bacterium]|nr:DUF6132 family protein [Alphaproteobacteria bacterium]
MQVLTKYIIKNKITIIGIVVGGFAGYLYYYFVGCANGTCAITSKPIPSSLYGCLIGGLFFQTCYQFSQKN